jgi:CopG family nickel-responsive transcriptional regulator
MSGLSRIGVAIDSDLWDKFDHLIGKRGYTNRSEAFRDLIRDELLKRHGNRPIAA